MDFHQEKLLAAIRFVDEDRDQKTFLNFTLESLKQKACVHVLLETEGLASAADGGLINSRGMRIFIFLPPPPP